MTNKELQDLLKQYPDDLPVYLSTDQDWSYNLNDLYRSDIIVYSNSYAEEIEEYEDCIILSV